MTPVMEAVPIFMDWIEIAVKTHSEGVDTISEVFCGVGIKGVLIQDPKDIELFKGQITDWDYVDEDLAYGGNEAVVKGYLPDNSASRDNIQYIKNRLNWLKEQDFDLNLGSLTLEFNHVKEEDWANNWKKYFKPKKIGMHIVVKPSWENYSPSEGEIVLELDPGMAFGTGTHETTALCIQALESRIKPDSSLLDIGTGTGILAIGGLLLGARNAIAVDLDLDAVEIARKNAVKNRVNDNIQVIYGNLTDRIEGKFDIVVCNIIADIIIEISTGIRSYLSPKGIFIASGIILDRIQDVKEAMIGAGLKILETKTMGEWAMMVAANE